MRMRWFALALVLSLAGNVLLATALWRTHRAENGATGVSWSCAPAPDSEERAAREQLAGLLVAQPPDRAAIAAALDRLDSVRSHHRERLLDQWLAKAGSAGDEAAAKTVRDHLCPWSNEGQGRCAPSPDDPNAQPTPSHEEGQGT